ncbi:serine hydrolase domain-containing protein [Leucobacter soli]|uniref:serine hydrolase domain-containing protein n=1 Tax=Leucobacter soli TaxID=2812850 RepID=UPI001C408637|nr:serine hydrolase domain-containing protein [Leucobacter soli]
MTHHDAKSTKNSSSADRAWLAVAAVLGLLLLPAMAIVDASPADTADTARSALAHGATHGAGISTVHGTAHGAANDTASDPVKDPAEDPVSSAPAILAGGLDRTALLPGLQAPAAWAVIETGGVSTGAASTGTSPSGAASTEGALVPGTVSGGAGGADADTPFLIGSLSKPVTAAAIMRLVDSGRLRLDAPVRDSLPEFRPQDADPITIAQLLSHTSGFDADAGLDARRDPTLSIQDRAARADTVPRAGAVPRATTAILDEAATPDGAALHDGVPFAYSNLNYAILGAVIEAESGLPFAEFLERELFAPLGMTRSTADPAEAQRIAASGHGFAFGVPFTRGETVPAGAAPDGYLVSTADDLAAFLRMLLREGLADDGTRILSAESVRAMLTPRTTAENGDTAAPRTDGYGLGWGTGAGSGTDASGTRANSTAAGSTAANNTAANGIGTGSGSGTAPIAAHVGRTDGFFAHAELRPSEGRAVVMLQAANGPLYDQTAPVQQIAAYFDGLDPDGSAGEPAAVTALVFAAFGAFAVGCVWLVGRLRRRSDRRRDSRRDNHLDSSSPAASASVTARREIRRTAFDIGGAIFIVLLWQLAAGLMLVGRPTLAADPLTVSIELSLIAWGVGAILLARGIACAAAAQSSRRRTPASRSRRIAFWPTPWRASSSFSE